MKIKKSLAFCAVLCAAALTVQGKDLSGEVNTLMGTGGYGLVAANCFPGATLPHGMLQFSPSFFTPQTGFAVNQMSGAGCPNMCNFPLLAMKGPLSYSPGNMVDCRIEISDEKGCAGYYASKVEDDIKAELTVTMRTGIARLTFPENAVKGTIIIGGGVSSTPVKNAALSVSGKSVEGYSEGGNFCGFPTPYKVYMTAETDIEPVESGVWKGDVLSPGETFTEGENSGVYFTFDLSSQKTVLYKVAISYVSVGNAKENLKAENPGWDFDKTRADAQAVWNENLSKIEIEAENPLREKQFYSHFYHALCVPNVCSDVNGEYMGADFKVHKSHTTHYSSFSNWDTYRTQIQLLAMLEPDVASEIVVSHQDFAEQSGGSFPRWTVANIETGIMQGDPSSILVSNAYAFGARNYDAKRLFKIMVKGATVPLSKSQRVETRPGLKQYLEKGWYNASAQLEYTSADFAIGQFALKAANDEFASWRFFKQAQSWKNLFNPETGWLQSRDSSGAWKPLSEDFMEATYKNYFWMVPYDYEGLFNLIGGRQAAEKRLDEYFTRIDASYYDDWFACGNEPTFGNPWIYNWTLTPHKTQALVNRIINDEYSIAPDGLPGNDDLGTMGAWYVFACAGLYPSIPGVGGFSVNTPIFSSVTFHLKNGDLKISGGGEKDIYIKSMTLDGKPYESTWIDWDSVKNGAEILYKTSSKPSKWGSTVVPPSFD